MSADAARAIFGEVRTAAEMVRHERSPSDAGPIVVSGVLADQLAKVLGAGSQPGAVQIAAAVPPRAEVLLRVVAGDPTPEDEAVVRGADRLEVPVVLVQLWPQAEWTRPFVLTPFVVECRTGEGFPIDEIADRVVDASDRDVDLAAKIPVLRRSVEKSIVRRTIVRAAALGVLPRGSVRALITLEQIRMFTRLTSLDRRRPDPDSSAVMASVGGAAGFVLASGIAFRGVARATRRVVPAPVANGIVAGAGTWAIAKAARVFAARVPS